MFRTIDQHDAAKNRVVSFLIVNVRARADRCRRETIVAINDGLGGGEGLGRRAHIGGSFSQSLAFPTTIGKIGYTYVHFRHHLAWQPMTRIPEQASLCLLSTSQQQQQSSRVWINASCLATRRPPAARLLGERENYNSILWGTARGTGDGERGSGFGYLPPMHRYLLVYQPVDRHQPLRLPCAESSVRVGDGGSWLCVLACYACFFFPSLAWFFCLPYFGSCG